MVNINVATVYLEIRNEWETTYLQYSMQLTNRQDREASSLRLRLVTT